MERIFKAGCFRDFGPISLDPSGPIPAVRHVQAATPGKLRAQVRLVCPRKPGVYGLIDSQGEVLYIGKAKCLRTRLLSYFRARGRPAKAGKLIRHTSMVAWETWPGEFAALVRELELIRRWRPRMNVQGQPLRRRHAFVCLGRRPAPYVYLHHQPPAAALAVYGPIPLNVWALEAVRRVNDLFRLRDCPQKQELIFPEQGELFPMVATPGCLRYDFATCLGPCAGACTRKVYHRQVKAARAFLDGTDLSALRDLEGQMQQASANLEFERAGALHDRCKALRWLAARLERLREVRERFSFVYPQGNLWFLVHGGRTIHCVPAASDCETAQRLRRLLRSVYCQNAGLLDSYEHVDGLMLISAWFRKHPGQLRRTLTPDEALERCSRYI